MQQVSVAVPAGQRLSIPPDSPPEYYQIMRACWKTETHLRPTFAALVSELQFGSSAGSEKGDPAMNTAEDHPYLDFTQGCYDAPRLMTRAESLEFRASRARANSDNISGRGSLASAATPTAMRHSQLHTIGQTIHFPQYASMSAAHVPQPASLKSTQVSQCSTLAPISVDDDLPSGPSSEILYLVPGSVPQGTLEDVIESLV